MGLNLRQQRFAELYVALGNATQAAIEAGYSGRTAEQQGSRLLRNAQVAATVAAGRAALSERSQVTADQIEEALAVIAFGDLRDVLDWGSNVDPEDGRSCPFVRLKASADLSDEAAASVAEVRLSTLGLSVKRHDRLKALELLGRMRGLFKDRVEHELPESITVRLAFDPAGGES